MPGTRSVSAQAEDAGIERGHAREIGRVQQHMAEPDRPHLMAPRGAAAGAQRMARIVDHEGRCAAPRRGGFGSHVDRVPVRGRRATARRRTRCAGRRAPRCRRSAMRARIAARPASSPPKRKWLSRLLRPLDEQHLVLVAPVAAEGEGGVALAGQQPEGRVEFPPRLDVRHGERVAQQRLHRHPTLQSIARPRIISQPPRRRTTPVLGPAVLNADDSHSKVAMVRRPGCERLRAATESDLPHVAGFL